MSLNKKVNKKSYDWRQVKYYRLDKNGYYPINTISENELGIKINWLEKCFDDINKMLPELFGDYILLAKKDVKWIKKELEFLYHLKETL